MPKGCYQRLTPNQIADRQRFLKEKNALPHNLKRSNSAAAKLGWVPPQKGSSAPREELPALLPPPPPPPHYYHFELLPPLPRLCPEGERGIKISERLKELEVETSNISKERLRQLESIQKETELLLVGKRLEYAQLVQEMNDLFGKALKVRRAQVVEMPARRPRSRWTGEEYRELRTHITRLLAGSQGLTVTAISRQLKVDDRVCHRMLETMAGEGVLRSLTVTVLGGKNSHRDYLGYSLAKTQQGVAS